MSQQRRLWLLPRFGLTEDKKKTTLFMPPSQLPPSSDIPLPHLVGPPPVPRDTKRGRAALWISLASWGVFASSLFIMASLERRAKTVALFGGSQTISVTTLLGLLVILSVLCALLGMGLGLGAWKRREGKAAFWIGGASLMCWTGLLVVGSL